MQNDAPLFAWLKRMLATLVLGVTFMMLSACAGTAAWDRDILAKQAMSLNTHPQVLAFHDHIYFSKEGSSGGRTTDGGGCGCN
jgi:hypothetical protein